MITATLKAWVQTIRALVTDLRALGIFALLYALLLASLYGFIATRVATVWEVVFTLFFLVLIPVEFFILQAAIVDQTRTHKFYWRAIFINALKLLIITIPILIIGYVLFVLLNKWQLRYPVPRAAITFPPAAPKGQPLHWPTLLFGSIRFLLFGIALPLATIHIWIEITGHDLRTSLSGGTKTIFKRLGSILSGAFASESVLVYALGLILFVLTPYAILFLSIPAKGTKTDFVVFILRLLLAFIFTLIGWIVTVAALAKTGSELSPAVPAKTVPAAPADAPA